MAAEKSGGAKLYSQNCASCPAAKAEGTDGCCAMMSGPDLLSVVSRMNGKEFLDEVRHVGETNMCAGHLLELSPADVEAVRGVMPPNARGKFPERFRRTELPTQLWSEKLG